MSTTRNKYIGTFLTKRTDTYPDGETIKVSIIPNLGDEEVLGDTIDLEFPYDEPVVITQESEGIFTPLKTQGCTISIFTDEIYWELYSKKPFDWYVKIENISRSTILYEGYLTPCAYTQDYAYNGILQLEAIDFLAAMDYVPYAPLNGEYRDIVSINDLLIAFRNLIPNHDTLSYDIEELRYDTTIAEFLNLRLQEANFFDDDDEETPWKWKEVLTEICKLLGFSLMYYNGKLVFQDYTEEAAPRVSEEDIDINRYAEGTPTIELDEVYNNIRINCNLYKVDDLTTDMFDEKNIGKMQNLMTQADKGMYAKYWWQWCNWGESTKAEHQYWSLIKPYTFKDNDKLVSSETLIEGWTSYKTRLIPELRELNYDTVATMADNDCNKYVDVSAGRPLFCPNYYSTCYPVKQFTYNMAEGMNTDSITWSNLLGFTITYDCKQSPHWGAWSQDPITGDKFIKYRKADIPALRYYNPHRMCYSTPNVDNSSKYIVIDAEVFWSTNNGIEGKDDAYGNIEMPYKDKTISGIDFVFLKPVCLSDYNLSSFDASDTHVCHKKGDTWTYDGETRELANTGFPIFKAVLRIGDKYWDGRKNIWTTTPSFFYLYFHDDDVYYASGEFEDDDPVDYFHIYQWCKIAANPNVAKYDANSSAYAIPVKASDNIYGDFELTIYHPLGKPVGWQKGENNKTLRETDILWMRNLSVEYKSNPYRWDEDVTEDEDIIYENDENISDYALEFSDIECKINSYWSRKPASKSYILNGNNIPLYCPLDKAPMYGGWTPETRLVQKYYNHYKTPKRIFNLNYHIGDLNPNKRFKHTGMDTSFVLDSWEFNVKNDTTHLKLIEL